VRISANCSTGITGFVEDEKLVFTRQICGGKLVTELIHSKEKITVLTIMPGVKKHMPAESAGKVESKYIELDQMQISPLGCSSLPSGGLDLKKAEVIVSAGRGVKEDQLDLIQDLANCFDKGAVGASRPLVDSGLLPMEHQVGQTGQTVSPRLYMACGISGALQHTVGMSCSELIVAINTDPNSLIWNTAHLGIQIDIGEFLPVLIEKLSNRPK
jgi:electron transfer flavoprotein alpha subunit